MAENEIRIKDLPSTQQINETDDVIVLDNATDGTRKLQGKVLLDMIHSAMAKGTASGAVASFTDGADNIPMTDLVVSIEPQQDLHGYDNPWVGGAGKNKLNPDYRVELAESTINYYLSNTQLSLSANTYCVSVSEACTISVFSYTGGQPTEIKKVYNSTSTSFTLESASDIGVQFYKSGGFTNITNTKCQLEVGSTATSFAPYSNECPISGWDECNVGVVGKNLLNPTIQKYSSPFVVYGGTITSNTPDGSLVLKAGTYTISTNERMYTIEVRDNPNNTIATEQGDSLTFTLTEEKAVKIALNKGSLDIDSITFQLEKGSTATDYEPYNGHTYTIDLDGTRYGGEVDVVSGVMTVTHGYVDLGSINWTYQATNKVFYTIRISDYLFDSSVSAICSQYGYIGTVGGGTASLRDDEYNGKCAFYYLSTGVSREFYIKDLAYDDATAFKQAVDGVQLVYELATPQTYQLTPTEVKSLLGVNNIFADTGNILNAEYVRDTTTIINQILARLNALES